MSAFSYRSRLASRAALLASALATTLVLSGLGAASATAAGVCTGESIQGEGAALQRVPQEKWNPGFNANGEGCIGGPTVTTINGGLEMAAWGLNGVPFNGEDVYVSADAPPFGPVGVEGTELNVLRDNLRKEGAEVNETDLVVIPVTQTSIAIVVNLPAECEVEKIKNAELEQVFRGSITTWAGLSTDNGGKGCSTAIKRVVRRDPAAMTYQLKHYLSLFNGANVCTAELGNLPWVQLQSFTAVGGVVPNQVWPDCGGTTEILRPANNGSGELVNKVNATDSSIGYAGLPEVKAHPSAEQTILKVQNSSLPTYVLPYTNTGSEAACGEVTYNRPKSPAGAEFTTWAEAAENPANLDWSAVYGSNPTIGGTKYPICTLTWSIAATNSSAVFGANAKTTLVDYLSYLLAAEGGRKDLSGNWYRELPSGPAEVANEAVESIK